MSIEERAVPDWCNKDNAELYRDMPIEYFKSLAKKVGLDNHCDLYAIQDHIKSSHSILEIGCGYGRVVEGIRKINPDAKVTLIERNERFADYVAEQYPECQLLRGDFLEMDLAGDSDYDLIMMMWSTLGEFSFVEFILALQKLKEISKKETIVVFEFCSIKSKHPYCELGKQEISVGSEYGNGNTFLPTNADFLNSISNFKFKLINSVGYETHSRVRRNIFTVSPT